MTGEPILDIVGVDGLQQTVWRIDDAEAEHRLAGRLQDQPLFIIDGHHRSAANRFLMDSGTPVPVLAAIFPEQSLRLVGFHRLVTLRPDIDIDAVVRTIARRFVVETISDVATVPPGHVALVANKEWHVVRFDERPVAGGPVIRLGSLDPVVLEREILTAILGDGSIVDVAYTPDTEPFATIADEAERQGQMPIFVPPVAIEDMMAVAEGGVIMPAKSTYFTPKVRSGLFLRLLDELD